MGGELVAHEFDAAERIGERAGDHPADAAPVQHAGQSPDVVQVIVREHE